MVSVAAACVIWATVTLCGMLCALWDGPDGEAWLRGNGLPYVCLALGASGPVLLLGRVGQWLGLQLFQHN